MNESITRAAGAIHGQETTPRLLEEIISSAGLAPWMRTTLYRAAPSERHAKALKPPDLTEVSSNAIAAQERRRKATA